MSINWEQMSESDIIRKDSNKSPYFQLHRIKQSEIDFPLFHYKSLDQTGLVGHGFTTRGGGVSQGIFESLNLSFTRGDEKEAVEENYRRLAEALGCEYERFVFTDQTHTTNVIRVTNEAAGSGIIRDRDYHDVDGLVTNEKGLVLSTFFADCVPLFFVDPIHKAIGMSHSGWRGTVGRMGEKTILKMKEEFNTAPEDLFCAIGPSICQDCYEVSKDVADAFAYEFRGHEEEILEKKRNDKYQLDLWRANCIVLEEAGVPADHIEVTNVCTCCNHKLLFSHRASQGKRGNLGAFMYIK